MYKAIYENPENKLGEKLDLKKGFKRSFSTAIPKKNHLCSKKTF